MEEGGGKFDYKGQLGADCVTITCNRCQWTWRAVFWTVCVSLTEFVDNEKHVKSVRPIEVHLTSETVGQSPRLHEQREQEIPDAGDDGRPELVEQQHEEAGLDRGGGRTKQFQSQFGACYNG